VYPVGYGGGRVEEEEEEEDIDEAMQQQSLMRDQDEQLEEVGITVGNLRQQAREMGDELDEQEM
jgi:archaellum component FlaC